MSERPTFSECVIGYRSWKLDDWVLSPVSYGSPWRPGVNHATCKVADRFVMWGFEHEMPKIPTHRAPTQACTCGLHAYHEIPAQPDGTGAQIVVGAVAAWGDLQVHSNGFRAEYAQIVALVAADGLDEVAALYGVPLVHRDVLAAEAHQHGTPLPASLRPKPVQSGLDRLALLYQQQMTQHMIYGAPATYHWSLNPQPISSPRYSSGGIQTTRISFDPAIWTPDDDKGKTPDDKLAKYRKPPANRQGPAKPKRAPKRLG